MTYYIVFIYTFLLVLYIYVNVLFDLNQKTNDYIATEILIQIWTWFRLQPDFRILKTEICYIHIT